ncbi:zwei Ig domain protein zig-8-like isoform X1 [Oratosquilla oratoria]|uniref:zwei Ig domain protein zig-8-like isoform X1 n=1 Tax=Oratosquilla oratoria TaxID=337810 RepID=UPI003F770088
MICEEIWCGPRGPLSTLKTFPLRASLVVLLLLLPLLASSSGASAKAADEDLAEVTEDPVGAIRHLLPEVNLERGRSITVVKGHRGETLFLPCRFPEVTQDQKVSWFRLRDWHILTTGVYTFTNDMRFSVLHTDGTIDWTLQLRKAQPSDNGTYECQMSTGSGVVSRFVEVMVAVPEARISTTKGGGSGGVGGSGAVARFHEGDTLTLSCVVKHTPSPTGVMVFWYHGSAMLNYGHSGGRHNITTKSEGMHAYSQLAITGVRPSDAGNYTCSSRNSRASTIVVSVTQDSLKRTTTTMTDQASSAAVVTVHVLCLAVAVLAVHTFTR